jgi:hypothetical protein
MKSEDMMKAKRAFIIPSHFIGLIFKEETLSAVFGAQLFMMLKLGHFGK